MTGIYSVYDLSTGLFSGDQVGGGADFLAANLLPGCGLHPGAWDRLRWCIDINSGLIAALPEPVPTLGAAKLARLTAVEAAITSSEQKKLRPMGAVLAALMAGQPPASADVQRLTSLEGRLAAARAAHGQIMAAASITELDAVAWPV